MTPPVYSERFLIAHTPAVWITWTVPAGHRAVIRTVSFVNDGQGASKGVVSRQGDALWTSSLPGASTSVATGLTLPLYAGEQLWLLVTADFSWLTAGGYLFQDDTGRRRAPGEVGLEGAEATAPLPSDAP